MTSPLDDTFLRDYQLASVNLIRADLLAGHQVICFQGPTAMGKTRIFTYMVYNAAVMGHITWVVVHRKELLRQSSEALTSLGVPHGLISPLYTPNPYAMVQVASIDTLRNRHHKFPTPHLIIGDEFHHAVSPTWFKILSHYIALGTRVIGFTATPNRLDGRGLGKVAGGLCDTLIVGPQPQELIDGGYLAKPIIYAAKLADPRGLHTKFGELVQAEREALMDTKQIIGDAVTQYTKICPSLPMITFVPSLKMAASVAEQYQRAGYQAAMVQGDMDDRERKGRIEALGGGGLHVLVSCALIDEGVDVPTVEAIQLLDPTSSVARFLQRCGRGARMFPGKKGYYLLDHVCNTFLPNMEPNHGDPSWDRTWTLDGDAKTKKTVATCPVRQCNLCWGVHKPAPKCPYCGHEYEVQAREIDQVDGELIAPTADQLAEAEAKQKAKKRPVTPARVEEWQAKTYEDFVAIGKARGYHPGWADRQWGFRGPKIQKNVQQRKDMAKQMGFL